MRRFAIVLETPAALVLGLVLMINPRLGDAQDLCRGDVDNNGRVNGADTTALVPLLFAPPTGPAATRADANEDGRLSSADASAIQLLNGRVCTTATPTGIATNTPVPSATATPLNLPTASPTPTMQFPFCDLPGSVITTAVGHVVIPGAPANAPDLTYLNLPIGFCAHYFARVGNARQLRFAPGGELFVASPTMITTSGGQGGQSSIIVLPDDDRDGVADSAITFLSGLPMTQGLTFTGGYFYYQDNTKIMRLPYTKGDRAPSAASEQVADITFQPATFFIHWPKPIDITDDGTIYVGNGGEQTDQCDAAHTFRGGIVKLDGAGSFLKVAKGFRNPISLRCPRGHNLCYAIELARDFTASQGGREKIVPIRQDDDWGFPCCATKNLAFPDVSPHPDCSGVASEDASFVIGETPFDLDFETGKWPAPWNHRVYVPLHGAAGTWHGARLVAIEMDPVTGEVRPGSDLPGAPSGALAEFASGWDDGRRAHGRPTNVAFAPDGRLFLGNDTTGDIIWIAPPDLQ